MDFMKSLREKWYSKIGIVSIATSFGLWTYSISDSIILIPKNLSRVSQIEEKLSETVRLKDLNDSTLRAYVTSLERERDGLTSLPEYAQEVKSYEEETDKDRGFPPAPISLGFGFVIGGMGLFFKGKNYQLDAKIKSE